MGRKPYTHAEIYQTVEGWHVDLYYCFDSEEGVFKDSQTLHEEYTKEEAMDYVEETYPMLEEDDISYEGYILKGD